jgi:hypothetical protein
MALMRPATVSSTWTANAVGGAPGRLGPVHGDGRRRVGVDRREQFLAECINGEQPAPDVVGPLHPELEGRHLEDGVVAQQANERVDVATFEGVDIGGQELTIVCGRRARRRVTVDGGERGASPADRAVDGVDARLQEHGDLRGTPAQHVAQDEHGSLPRSEVLQRSDEGEPHRLP